MGNARLKKSLRRTLLLCKTTKQLIIYEEKSRCSLIDVYPEAMRCRAF